MALINSKSKVNTIYSIYATNLRLQIETTNIYAQKNDNSFLETYNKIIAVFQIFDNLGCLRFFLKIILLVNLILKIIFGIFS